MRQLTINKYQILETISCDTFQGNKNYNEHSNSDIPKQAETHLWFGDKSLTWNCKDVLNTAEILGHDGKATALFAPFSGYKSLQKNKKMNFSK